MVEDSERVDQVKRPVGKRQREEIRLNSVYIAAIGKVSSRLIDRSTEIDSDNVSCVRRQLPCMTAHAATRIQDDTIP